MSTVESLDLKNLHVIVLQEFQTEEIQEMASRVASRLSTGCAAVVISGHGEFLARRVAVRMGLENNTISLAEQLGDRISSCAAAHAVAVLAREAVGL